MIIIIVTIVVIIVVLFIFMIIFVIIIFIINKVIVIIWSHLDNDIIPWRGGNWTEAGRETSRSYIPDIAEYGMRADEKIMTCQN